jgi:hypothetical protein
VRVLENRGVRIIVAEKIARVCRNLNAEKFKNFYIIKAFF